MPVLPLPTEAELYVQNGFKISGAQWAIVHCFLA